MLRSSVIWVVIFSVIALMFVRLPPMAARQDSVLHTYSSLVEVDALAKQRYVEEIPGNGLVDGAIRGMLLELDPYSGYIAPGELPAFERRSKGRFTGVGVEIGMGNGRLIVIAPLEGGPASRAGVRPGDRLLAIDGVDLKDRSVFDVEEMLVGPPETGVELTVQHADQDQPIALTITRGPITLHSVHGFRRNADGLWDYWIDRQDRVGYVRISSFRENTAREFENALRQLHAGHCRSLILDLRFNPGGLMSQAVKVVDQFLDGGVIVSTVNRHRAVEEYRAAGDPPARTVPLVVLLNGHSASAAEIVAGSLQAHRRAVVIGETSFGKGSVQHLIYLTDQKAAIKLTVAYYRLPDGRIIHRSSASDPSAPWGVKPDIEVALTEDEMHQIRESRHNVDLGIAAAVLSETGKSADALPLLLEDSAPSVLLDRQLVVALAEARRLAHSSPP